MTATTPPDLTALTSNDRSDRTGGPDGSSREFRLEHEHVYDRRSPARWIVSHVRRYPLHLLGFVGAAIGTALVRSMQQRLTGAAFDVVDRAISGGASAEQLAGAVPLVARPFVGLGALVAGDVMSGFAISLAAIALAMLALALLNGVTTITSAFSVEVIGQRLERDARDELYVSLLGKSQTFHDRQQVGDVMARAANDVRQLNPMMNPGVALILDSMSSLVVPIVFIAFIDVRLLVAPLAFVVLFAFALRRYTRQLNPVSGRMRMEFGVMNSGLAETVSGIEVVKSAAQEPAERAKFDSAASAYRDTVVEQGQIQARYLPPLLLGICTAFAFAHGAVLVGRGELGVGELVAYLGLMGVLRFASFISIFTFTLVQLGLAGAGRILELIDQETDLDENVAGRSERMRGEIEFDDVSFGFGDKRVLEGVSFNASPGETVAIVGQAGGGKTTLTNLVQRIYDVDEGRVLVDGVDVRDWSLESLRGQISQIEQDVFLFSRSVHDNIAFGRGGVATREAVEAAAREAQAHDFIQRLEKGYDTLVGERGARLSGGQRQRIAIARALLTDPRILILDDSTSAIDSATEDEIQRAMERVRSGRTTLLITHRLSQIRWADRILMLDRGRLIDSGTHEELLDRCELYGRIFARTGGSASTAVDGA